jgi:hypothetical protein
MPGTPAALVRSAGDLLDHLMGAVEQDVVDQRVRWVG